jgi:iron-sulfur cluster assembly protein
MIDLTDSAVNKIKEVLKDTENTGVRAAIQGGGCSGFTYKLTMEKEPDPDDKVIEIKGVKLFVDKKSYLFLIGTTIDFVSEMMQMGFKFINPNAKRTCGCGESFGI